MAITYRSSNPVLNNKFMAALTGVPYREIIIAAMVAIIVAVILSGWISIRDIDLWNRMNPPAATQSDS